MNVSYLHSPLFTRDPIYNKSNDLSYTNRLTFFSKHMQTVHVPPSEYIVFVSKMQWITSTDIFFGIQCGDATAERAVGNFDSCIYSASLTVSTFGNRHCRPMIPRSVRWGSFVTIDPSIPVCKLRRSAAWMSSFNVVVLIRRMRTSPSKCGI